MTIKDVIRLRAQIDHLPGDAARKALNDLVSFAEAMGEQPAMRCSPICVAAAVADAIEEAHDGPRCRGCAERRDLCECAAIPCELHHHLPRPESDYRLTVQPDAAPRSVRVEACAECTWDAVECGRWLAAEVVLVQPLDPRSHF